MCVESETRYFTLEEVSRNNGKESKSWVIISGNVYDITEYLEEHPGGVDLMEEWLGKDATKAFKQQGHSSDAKKLLQTYKIGQIRTECSNVKTNDSKCPIVVDAKENDKIPKSCMSKLSCGLCG